MLRFLVWIVFLLGGTAFGIFLDLRWFPELWHNLYFHLITLIPGVFLLRMTMLISRNTGRFLAKHGRDGDIPRFNTNRLVTTGMYGCMRHPMHLGLLLFPVSFALIVGSPVFITMIAPTEILLIILLIKLVEEPEAERKFGEAYKSYKKVTPMFSLRKKCLKMLIH